MQTESQKGIDNLTLDDLIAEACQREFYFFVQEFWAEIISEKPVWNWHIKVFCEELQEIAERVKRRERSPFDWIIFNVPPGSSKSTIISVMYPMWVWTIDPSQRFICGSYSSMVSEDLADKAKTIFTSDKYKRLFPEVGIKSESITRLKNKHKAERYTTSTGSGITGVHAHQIIIDDPLNTQSATSEADRLTANNWINKTLGSRMVNKEVTASILVMQRLHEEDPTGMLLEKAAKEGLRVKHICIPAELPKLSENNVFPIELREKYINGLFDPIRANVAALQSQKVKLGSFGYAGQYDQRPADLSGGVFKRDWFEIVDVYHQDKVKKFQLDTAYTEKAENDPTGMGTYFVENNTVYITDWQTHRLEFPELCKWVITTVPALGYTDQSIIRVEPKASGKSLVQALKKETKLNITESENPEKDKPTRAAAISARCEAGRVKLLRGAWNEAFINEVCTFPKAKHDEAVDVLVEIVRNELQEDSWSNLVFVKSLPPPKEEVFDDYPGPTF